MSTPDQLISELEFNARASGNRALERRLADLVLWYWKNRGDIPPDNLAARNALAEKGLMISFEVMALTLERIHELEGRGRKNLWVPKGVAVNGDLRRFG